MYHLPKAMHPLSKRRSDLIIYLSVITCSVSKVVWPYYSKFMECWESISNFYQSATMPNKKKRRHLERLHWSDAYCHPQKNQGNIQFKKKDDSFTKISHETKSFLEHSCNVQLKNTPKSTWNSESMNPVDSLTCRSLHQLIDIVWKLREIPMASTLMVYRCLFC